ncbi:MAG: DUF4911 domain-containing protein [Bacteriovoracaceae bacterium]|jgi:hypothetical protein|nr:DUF4911 domain-containing protein [Bacteriovoracaceae bacterium]
MSDQLRQITVRVNKKDASMLYFILEANENIAFYSTLDGNKSEGHRDICLNTHISLCDQLENILNHFSKKYSLEILKDITITDSL